MLGSLGGLLGGTLGGLLGGLLGGASGGVDGGEVGGSCIRYGNLLIPVNTTEQLHSGGACIDRSGWRWGFRWA